MARPLKYHGLTLAEHAELGWELKHLSHNVLPKLTGKFPVAHKATRLQKRIDRLLWELRSGLEKDAYGRLAPEHRSTDLTGLYYRGVNAWRNEKGTHTVRTPAMTATPSSQRSWHGSQTGNDLDEQCKGNY